MHISDICIILLRIYVHVQKGRRQEKLCFCCCVPKTRGGGVSRAGSKNYHLLFLLPFDPEAFKMCKNTQIKNNLCVQSGVVKDRLSN